MATVKPNPYVPSFLRAAVSGSRPLTLKWGDVADTNILSTASFAYEPQSYPLKSSQQLNVDWSKFENHTFFMSAEAKVNLAFDAIINGYPFDGTRQEIESFFDKLPGFERWVFNNFPTFRGELHLSGTQVGEDTDGTLGTYITVQNKTGALFPELAKNNSGEAVLNPTGSLSMTIEMQLHLPAIANDTQVVCQILSGSTQGLTFYLAPSVSTTSVTGWFAVINDNKYMTAPVQLSKGEFNHVALILNKENGVPFLDTYVATERSSQSSTRVDIGDLDIDGSDLIIGSGSAITFGATTITPTQTLSGTLDEFRIFHSVRTVKQQAAYARKPIFSTSDLVLYYRFNEPPAPIVADEDNSINAIVLDSSGNSLHALVENFTGSLRLNAAEDVLSPMTYELAVTAPVLFPAYQETIDFNAELLASASLYDQANPNLITRLIPQHYLLEGTLADGFTEIEGMSRDPYSYVGDGIPGQGKMGNVQILVSLLYIWARFFDDVKLFVDAFNTLKTVDYETNETVPDNFLLDLVKSYGFHLPPLFNDSTIEQYIRGENVDTQDITVNEYTLKSVQSTLLRRVLINLPDVLKSKGTQHSIKSFLRAVGIDPGNNVRIREFGGPTTQQLSFSRESKIEQGTMVNFTTASYVISPFLSASRYEPGYPEIVGTFVQENTFPPNGISNNRNDGLLTSGSWTWEGIVKYTPINRDLMLNATQSIVRLCCTGSLPGNATGSIGVVANLVAVSSSLSSDGFGPKLALWIRPGDSSTSPALNLQLDTSLPGIFNFDRWNVSFGCQRGDDNLDSPVSSSYFLRLAYQNDGKIEVLQTTSSFLDDTIGNNVLRVLNTATNASGCFLSFGAGQLISEGTGSNYPHLNDNSRVPDEARATDFNGRLSNVRFWSKALSLDEWKEHVRNYNSVGVTDPLVNWNYVTTRSGSFGKLRMNSMIRQETRQAYSTASSGIAIGDIQFIDFSENGFHLTGSNFPIEEDVVVGEVFDLSYISPYFDEASNNEKIRVRSFQNQDLIDATPWAGTAPIHEIVKSEQPTDDVRFSIEFSLIDALNRDMITMFATLDALDNALGSPELVFSPDYPDLDRLRNVYFNRIKQKLNFQAFFEFYRWFDTSIGTFIQQLIPRKTRFKGTNFTIESHMLERAKQEYLYSEMYVGDSNRLNLNSVILLQQIAGTARKY